MNNSTLFLKLTFITGLRKVAIKEVNQYRDLEIIDEDDDVIYLNFANNLDQVKQLRSITKAYLIVQDEKYNPVYLSRHKSILSNIIDKVLTGNKNQFKTFKITCAGSDSPEIQSIADYIKKTYHLTRSEEADLKLHIVLKSEGRWEIGVQVTPRPLSFRDYKIKNISGAMDPTIAYAMNSLCEIKRAKTYLNIFSGSATLLIEAGQTYPHLESLVGFDKDKKHLSGAIQNIKQAGLVKRVILKEADIFNPPELGKFDIITADLPFGMAISKNEDLENLYRTFVEYCQEAITPRGRLAVYTTQYGILEKILSGSRFKITKTLDLKFITSTKTNLRPKIFICRFK